MTFDVFLSHNSREKPVVERLAQKPPDPQPGHDWYNRAGYA
jgi:hypothetical protein